MFFQNWPQAYSCVLISQLKSQLKFLRLCFLFLFQFVPNLRSFCLIQTKKKKIETQRQTQSNSFPVWFITHTNKQEVFPQTLFFCEDFSLLLGRQFFIFQVNLFYELQKCKTPMKNVTSRTTLYLVQSFCHLFLGWYFCFAQREYEKID